MNPQLEEFRELIDEMAKRGYLDAFVIRHHTEVPAHVEGAVSRLVAKVRGQLSIGSRLAIEAEEHDRQAVPEIVAATLVEVVNGRVDPDPVASFLEHLNGRYRHLPRAVRNRIYSAGRKAVTHRLPLVAVDDGFEVAAVDEGPAPELPQLPQEWQAAARRLEARGATINKRNLARELGISERHLRRRMSAFRENRA